MKRKLLATLLGLATSAVIAHGQGSIIFGDGGSGFQAYNPVVWTVDVSNSGPLTLYYPFTNSVPDGAFTFPTNLFGDFSSFLGTNYSGLFGTNTSGQFSFQIVTWDSSGFSFGGSSSLWTQQPPGSGLPVVIGFPVIINSAVPPNDYFANAIVLSGTVISAIATNYLATAEPGEPQHLPGTAAAHSSWWRWVPDISLPTTLTLNAYAGTVVVYEGDTLSSLQRVATLTATNSPLPPPIEAIGAAPTVRASAGSKSVFIGPVIGGGGTTPPLLPRWPGYPPVAPTVSFQTQAGHTYYIAAEGAAYIAWKVEQQVLDFVGPTPQHGNVGVPMEFEVASIDTNNVPLNVEFFVGRRPIDTPLVYGPSGFTQVIQIDVQRELVPYGNLQIVSQSGVLSEPPFAVTWTPTNVGPHFIWARSTNSVGEVHETLRLRVDVCSENDDFAQATALDPNLERVDVPFAAYWATVESNEPPHRAGGLRFTRWWKWTPTSTANVRVKAERYRAGLPLEVFTGSTENDLKWIADNRRTYSQVGISGIIRLKVRAGRTYYFRTDEDSRTPLPSDPMSYSTALLNTLTIEPANTPLPAEVDPSQIMASWIGRGGIRIVTSGRVYRADGFTPLVGSNYRAQVYAGPSQDDLEPAGFAMIFYPQSYVDAQPDFAGLYGSSPTIISNAIAGQRVFVQMRVWNSDRGSTFEEAAAAGSAVGKSRVISVVAGSEEVGPTPLWRIGSFSLREPRRE